MPNYLPSKKLHLQLEFRKFIDLPTSISAADLEVDMDNKLWACFTNGDPCFIFNGDKWNEINSENSDICDGYMSNLHLSNDSILYFIGPFGYFCSYNGTNFTNLKQHINKLSFSYLAAIVSSSNGKDLFIAGASLYNDNGIIAQFTENNTTYFDFNEGLIKQLIVDMVLDANGKLMVFSEDSISYEGTLLATTTSEVELFQDFIESNIVYDQLEVSNPENVRLAISIISVAGNLVLPFREVEEFIDLNFLKSGIYIVQIFKNGIPISTEKIIKI